MDEATLRAEVARQRETTDVDAAHAMYHDDAVLEKGWDAPDWRARWRAAP